jgi:hypothetical protein
VVGEEDGSYALYEVAATALASGAGAEPAAEHEVHVVTARAWKPTRIDILYYWEIYFGSTLFRQRKKWG